MHHKTPPAVFASIRESLIEIAWDDRGNELGLLMAARLPWREPRIAVLKLDWYTSQRRQREFASAAAYELDGYFDNVTGRYRGPEAGLSERELTIRTKRAALLQEARKTGDDTKLREYEAAIEAQRQAELELRIERIDAWIAENRDRLEAEAAAYAEERRNRSVGQAQD